MTELEALAGQQRAIRVLAERGAMKYEVLESLLNLTSAQMCRVMGGLLARHWVHPVWQDERKPWAILYTLTARGEQVAKGK